MRFGTPWPLLLTLLIPVLPLLAEEEEPPTPEERVAELRKEYAEQHAKLGVWATSKKLGRSAKAQFIIAIHLDPDCRRARQKLGHRRGGSGEWEPGRKKEWEYGRGAVEKYGEEFRQRESTLVDAELVAFEQLGLALLSEGRPDLGRPLVLRVHLLGPRREGAAKGLGLEKLPNGFALPEIVTAVRDFPKPEDPGIDGMLKSILGVKTITRRCHSVVAETIGDRAAADKMAVITHRAQVLTAKRLGAPPRGIGWVTVFAAKGKQQWDAFIDRLGFPPQRANAAKQIGSARMFRPRHFIGVWVGPMADPASRTHNLVHMAAEHVIWMTYGMKVPAWIYESAALDATLDMLGVPGAPCVAMEESAGIQWKDAFKNPETWGRAILRRAGMSDLPRLATLLRAQIQALSLEDIIVGHAYYRFMLRERLPGLRDFLKRIREQEEPEAAFKSAFGATPEEIEEEFLSVILGG